MCPFEYDRNIHSISTQNVLAITCSLIKVPINNRNLEISTNPKGEVLISIMGAAIASSE